MCSVLFLLGGKSGSTGEYGGVDGWEFLRVQGILLIIVLESK